MSKNVGWKQIHEALLGLAQRASELDWEIGRALLAAEEARCHEQLGYGLADEDLPIQFRRTLRQPQQSLVNLLPTDVLAHVPSCVKRLSPCGFRPPDVGRESAAATERVFLSLLRLKPPQSAV